MRAIHGQSVDHHFYNIALNLFVSFFFCVDAARLLNVYLFHITPITCSIFYILLEILAGEHEVAFIFQGMTDIIPINMLNMLNVLFLKLKFWYIE